VRSHLRAGALAALLAASVLLAGACQPAAPRPQAGGRVVATIALPGVMVESMNPYAHSTTQIYPTWKHVIEPLVEWDWAKKDLVGVLAESWSTPEPTTWVFKLRQGVKFHMDAPVGPDQYAYSPDLQPKYTYDPARAKQLLAQAGYPDGFEVEFLVPVGQYNKIKELAEAVASMLASVGIRARIQTQDQNTGFAAIQQGKAPLYIFGRGGVIDPDEYLDQYFHTGVTKRLEYSDPEVDAALEAERAAFDPSQRVTLLRRAMSRLMEEAPAVWLFQYQGIEGVSNRFDYTPNPGEDVYAWDLKPRQR